MCFGFPPESFAYVRLGNRLWTVRSWSCRLISACLDRAEQNAEMRKMAGLTDAAARGLPVRPDISRRRRDTDSVQDCPGLPAGFSVGTG